MHEIRRVIDYNTFQIEIHIAFYCYRHRACNIFARTYYELWLQEENVGQEIMIEDLTVCISVLLHQLTLRKKILNASFKFKMNLV